MISFCELINFCGGIEDERHYKNIVLSYFKEKKHSHFLGIILLTRVGFFFFKLKTKNLKLSEWYFAKLDLGLQNNILSLFKMIAINYIVESLCVCGGAQDRVSL